MCIRDRDYSQKEQKHPITKAVLAPMKAVKKMLVSMELHLDASIDKLDNLAMNVKLDKEKHMENMKTVSYTHLDVYKRQEWRGTGVKLLSGISDDPCDWN